MRLAYSLCGLRTYRYAYKCRNTELIINFSWGSLWSLRSYELAIQKLLNFNADAWIRSGPVRGVQYHDVRPGGNSTE